MLLVVSNEPYDHHSGPSGHPEHAGRSRFVLEGIAAAGIGDAVEDVPARPATVDELVAVHGRDHLRRLEAFCSSGGGRLDPDTYASPGSWSTALLAAGAGLVACEALRRGEGDAAFVVARPPGHHAGARQAMGFCLLNNVAVAAADLAAKGERVVIVDWDVHHGNGTQDIFWEDPRVLYVSTHQAALYPGTGRWDETGAGAGAGTTVNVPLPGGATGDVLLRAVDEVVAPVVERFGPTWVLISAGFDAHRADPLAGLDLTAGDFADLAARVRALAPAPGRLVLFLEGGYDAEALRLSAGAAAAAAIGVDYRPEPSSSGGNGSGVVDRLAQHWASGVT